jgi:uncharacterized membrane protein YesL
MTRSARLAVRAVELCPALDQGVRHLTLNALWTAGCLTVVGAPAATVAAHRVLGEWSEGDDRPVTGRFVAGLRAHGWHATALGLIAVPVLALLALNLWVVPMMGEQRYVLVPALLAVTIPALLFLATAPAILAEGHPSLVVALRRIGRATVGRPIPAAAGLLLAAAVALAALAFPPLLLVTPSLAAILHRAVARTRRTARTPTGRQLV